MDGAGAGVFQGGDLVGRLLDERYRVERKLGKGGMATVYLATDERIDRPVVVKIPHLRFLEEEGFRARFEREIRSLTRIGHPHIVRVLDVGMVQDCPYAVLEYLSGGSLKDRLDSSGGRHSLAEVLDWLPAIAQTLDHIHRHGIVHRDVKPANILFGGYGHAILADFGVAKALGEATTGLTLTGGVIGSPEYMAPEVLAGGPVTPAYDQYSLGIIVYQALAGVPPHQADTPMAFLYKRCHELADDVRGLAPEVDTATAEAVMRALAHDPAERFGTCLEFAEALERRGDARPRAGAPVVPVPEGAPRWRQRECVVAPSPGAALVHDVAGARTLAFIFFRCWVWEEGEWRDVTPEKRGNWPYNPKALFFDSGRGGLVAWEGDELREFRDEEWHALGFVPAELAQRSGFAWAFDGERGRLVVHGGVDHVGGAGEVRDETWEWDGSAWRRLFPSVRPLPRRAAAMAYDAHRRVLVLHGGRNAQDVDLADTWLWDGDAWSPAQATQGLPARSSHAMVYDPVRELVLAFGGAAQGEEGERILEDTWTWDGGAWRKEEHGAGPSGRILPSLAFDAPRRSLVLFAGFDGTKELRDTWEFGYE